MTPAAAISPTSSNSASATLRKASSRPTSSSRRETETVPVHQGYIEPHAGTAQWGVDGKLTIWSSSQGQFTVRDHTARFMGIPVADVKAIPLEIGGGFGAKTVLYVEPVAALLSRKSGHPVKVQMSRKEVFEATGPTSGTKIKVKVGATKEGKLVAAESTLIYEAGAFPRLSRLPRRPVHDGPVRHPQRPSDCH